MRFVLIALLLGTTACGSGGSGRSGVDPAEPANVMPSGIPAADGPVRTRGLATVIDEGEGPELCLGAVAASHPPRCGGPAIVDWDWSEHTVHQQSRGVRWGSFAVTGTFDGESVTVTDAVPAALYDPMAPGPGEDPECGSEPCPSLTDDELREIRQRLGDLPGMQTVEGNRAPVTVTVVHDDGSLQEWADAEYGEGAVRVVSLLVPSDASPGSGPPLG
ncbi:hypothetical protein KUV85_17005 [Nocardioides panacisoli]|uniref:hypothetical protein n=1 Tax=Nocardioides panacisoli TaxID=627624 RepID=UPI001C636DE4|nr:hypothetical protein [Nocardioides panacisoli]QYJ03999.1 hypothetical protein KUV85_17005 [Nocardioides panacisoli]